MTSPTAPPRSPPRSWRRASCMVRLAYACAVCRMPRSEAVWTARRAAGITSDDEDHGGQAGRARSVRVDDLALDALVARCRPLPSLRGRRRLPPGPARLPGHRRTGEALGLGEQAAGDDGGEQAPGDGTRE